MAWRYTEFIPLNVPLLRHGIHGCGHDPDPTGGSRFGVRLIRHESVLGSGPAPQSDDVLWTWLCLDASKNPKTIEEAQYGQTAE